MLARAHLAREHLECRAEHVCGDGPVAASLRPGAINRHCVLEELPEAGPRDLEHVARGARAVQRECERAAASPSRPRRALYAVHSVLAAEERLLEEVFHHLQLELALNARNLQHIDHVLQCRGHPAHCWAHERAAAHAACGQHVRQILERHDGAVAGLGLQPDRVALWRRGGMQLCSGNHGLLARAACGMVHRGGRGGTARAKT